jgi:dsDNA-specific endonuclease/ATPase MutS2
MKLQEYWGVGPKTRDLLADEIGEKDAAEAIEKSDVRALVDAGLPRGRATRIVRRAKGGEGLDVLATRDARDVYKSLLDRMGEYAVTDEAEDRVTVMTPFTDSDDAEERLERVWGAVVALETLGDDVVEAFEGYDETDGARVETALGLREAGADEEFEAVGELDEEALRDALGALRHLEDGSVAEGADEELDSLRRRLEAVRELEEESFDLAERLSGGAADADELREAFVDHVVAEADVTYDRVQGALEEDALDATDFVTESLRALLDSLRTDVEEREEEVTEELRGRVERNREEVDDATEAVREVAFLLSLARFADSHDLSRPEYVDEGVSVRGARNLALESRGEVVQPVDYAVGRGDGIAEGEVAVLTGANSGGKTTLLETMCEVVLLAQMGVPVAAEEARVSVFDDVVFHRRHSSFNAGVLESTLRSVVPPLTDEGDALMLVDEFEAITEPGSAADLLHGLVTLTVERDAVGVFVTHLADDLEPLPETARVDGIFAEGLDDDLELDVDYQPRFGTVGRSTPEFIVSRLIAESDGRENRAGYDVLARAVGVEKVQKTLDEV